ncbi:S8 family peptidase [Dyella sp. 20L07]|uniref:S8 family peptidase n=1 Tax=Dyella sp. 20L07 TaxID=3384240 RepID=UPI003D2677CA
MNKALVAALILGTLSLCGCALAPTPLPTQAYASDISNDQLLVMIKTPAPHLHAGNDYTGNYIAAPDETGRHRVAAQLAQEYGLTLLGNWPMPALSLDCFVMQTGAGMSMQQTTTALTRDARVESVEPMQLFHVLGKSDPLYPLQPTAIQWHLAELHAATTGRHVTIAELDSGVDTSNPDLAGQVTQTRNFVDDGAYRAELHGTEVAGIIVAREGNGVGIAGVSPNARLLALRACWQPAADTASATCTSFTLAKAIQYALDNRANILNLSLAGPHDPLLERLLAIALARHITIVGAVDDSATDGGFPASFPGVLAIADERAASLVISGAMRAPGEDIPTTLPGARWDLVTGSSFSAAEVTGLVALIRELSPDIAPEALRNALNARTALGLVTLRPTVIDACAAVARVSGHCTCDCATANASTSVPRR